MTFSSPDIVASDALLELREMDESMRLSPRAASLRLAMLRMDFPEAIVQIDPVRQDDVAVAVKATIGLPGGARHTYIATADVDPSGSWSDQFAAVQAAAVSHALDGLGIHLERRKSGERVASPVTKETRSRPADPDHLSEYSWNAFWKEANVRGITRDQVEHALGRSVQEVSPHDALGALKSTGVWD